MARVEVPITIINSSTGLPVNGAAVAISHRATGTPAPWYPSEAGGAPSTSAAISDTAGRVTAWVERGQYSLSVTGTGLTPYTEAWDAVPGGDLTVDASWISDTALIPGEIKMYGGAVPPTGWLTCDGSQVLRSAYPRLWTAIGTGFGAGDGSTTFNLPDLRGRFPLGAGSGPGLTERTRGSTGGTEAHVLTAAQSGVGAHGHSNTFSINSGGAHAHNTGTESADHAHNISVGGMTVNAGSGYTIYQLNTAVGLPGTVGTSGRTAAHSHGTDTHAGHGHGISGGISSNSADASTSHPHMPPFVSVNYIIKT